jgi:hypothetical protein
VNWVSGDNLLFPKTPDWQALMQSMTQQSLAGMTALRQKRSITNVRLDEKAQEDGIGPARNADGYFQQGRRQK